METYVGIDISRDTPDIAIKGDDKPRQFMNTPDGIRAICDFLTKLKPTLIVFEATGGYEMPLYIALTGVAPLNRDSGTLRGKRTIWGGRATVRGALYMATLVATRFNPVIRQLYQRLLDSGKLKKVAIVACMQKLLIILNSMVKHNTKWSYSPCFD